MKGKLYLIPTVLAEGTQENVLPPAIRNTVKNLEHFLCENVRSARRFVSSLQAHPSMEALRFDLLDKDTGQAEVAQMLQPLLQGTDMGLLSESGCPAVADPGALAVGFAHQHDIVVVPLVGPSSLMLALMASGLNGQCFAFHGYLPVDAKSAGEEIQKLERESREKNQTQIFIETPYRNNQLLGHLIRSLKSTTRLCLAVNLTSPEEKILCKTVAAWEKEIPKLDKVPVTYLFLAS